jgi:hypothetical protein
MEAEAQRDSMTDLKPPPSDQSSSNDDLEKALAVDAPDVGQPPAEDPRPGAKAGLTLTQFWIVMLGFVTPSLFVMFPPGKDCI